MKKKVILDVNFQKDVLIIKLIFLEKMELLILKIYPKIVRYICLLLMLELED